MNLESLSKYVNDPKRTRAELEQMKANALAKGNTEAANLVNEVFLRRFQVRGRTGVGRTLTEVSFKGQTDTFESGKEGYLWLVDKFRAYQPTALQAYVDLVGRRRSTEHGSRFATNPVALFPKGSKRTSDPQYYSALGGGWFADTNINHADKFAALLKLSYVCGLEYPSHWEFKPIGSTEQLRQHQDAQVRARKILDELVGIAQRS